MSYIKRLLISIGDWLFDLLWKYTPVEDPDLVGVLDDIANDMMWSTTFVECGCGLRFNAFEWDFEIAPCHTHMQLGV